MRAARGVVLMVASLALGACASQGASVRTLPAENPAAQNAAAADSAAAFAAAATGSAPSGAAADAFPERLQDPGVAAAEPVPSAPPVTPEDAPPMRTYDPWERLNRLTYRLNARFDEALFLPAANLYRRAPAPLRAGVHHFFGNLSEVDSTINYLLQGRFRLGWRSIERFVINSSAGIGGLLDVATRIKLPGAPTGWGNTLAIWGMHPGPYWVIPILGPSSLRDGLGFFADYGTSYGVDVAGLYRGNASWGLATLNGIDQRANVDFRYYGSGSPFEYENIRFLYVRKTLIQDDALRTRGSPRHPPDARRPQDPELPAGK